MPPSITGIIVNLVPYHHARWEAFARSWDGECHLVELRSTDNFKVLEFSAESTYQRSTLFAEDQLKINTVSELVKKMTERLDKIRPNVVCVSGWGLPVSLAAMQWASVNAVPIVMLSESNEFDEARSVVKEWVKKHLIGLCSSGLAGGTPQTAYLEKLGLGEEVISTGYDVVDNDYFRRAGEEVRIHETPIRIALGLPKRYFLACARFGTKKNHSGLVRAYAQYCHQAKESPLRLSHGTTLEDSVCARQSLPCDLVIVGEGEERFAIEQTIRECGVTDHVHLIGPVGYDKLPSYYALAETFIHPSTTEQWGLVVIEAMASGLPVLVSKQCGCAADLVRDGENGWTFNPNDEAELARLMAAISSDEGMRLRMGRKSLEMITGWGPDRFASGLTRAINAALAAPKRKSTFLGRNLLNFLLLM